MNIKYLAFATLLFLVSCGGESPTQDTSVNMEEEGDEFNEFADQNFYLPSALQISSLFKSSGLKFVNGITNSPDKVSTYSSMDAKYLSFGVYSADLSYCILNNQIQEATKYLGAVRKLASEVGMESIFTGSDIFERFEKNIGNPDSILTLIAEIQENTDIYIDDNNMKEVTYIIFAGAWVEGMYLGVKATEGQRTKEISKRLLEQMIVLENLIKALSSTHKTTPEFASVLKQLNNLRTIYYSFDEIKNRDGDSFNNVEISEENIKRLGEKITEIRNSIVGA